MKNLKLLTLFLIGTFWVGSCAKEDLEKSGFNLDEAFEIQIGEYLHSKNENIKIKINSVLEDSRCPINALCIWEGQVKLETEITIEDQVFVKELIFQESKEFPLECGGYIFQILSVIPPAQIDEIIELEDYIFNIIIKKN